MVKYPHSHLPSMANMYSRFEPHWKCLGCFGNESGWSTRTSSVHWQRNGINHPQQLLDNIVQTLMQSVESCNTFNGVYRQLMPEWLWTVIVFFLSFMHSAQNDYLVHWILFKPFWISEHNKLSLLSHPGIILFHLASNHAYFMCYIAIWDPSLEIFYQCRLQQRNVPNSKQLGQQTQNGKCHLIFTTI